MRFDAGEIICKMRTLSGESCDWDEAFALFDELLRGESDNTGTLW